MAKKPTTGSAKKTPAKAPAAAKSRTSGVRNSPVPKKAKPAAAKPAASAAAISAPVAKVAEITQEMIAKRAYEISQSGTGGSDLDNWFRAERELLGL